MRCGKRYDLRSRRLCDFQQQRACSSVTQLHCTPRPASYNPYFEGIVKREFKLRFVDRLKNTLLKEPDWMALADDIQERRGDYLGKLRVSHFVRNYPLVFEFTHDDHKYKWLRFTTPARQLFLEHKNYKRDQHRPYAVEAVTKLLMLSKNRRLEAKQVARLGKYFGFPRNYETSIFCSNPKYFRPVDFNGVRCLELSQWHPELAITAREKWLQDQSQISNPYAFPQPGCEDSMPEDVRSYFQSLQKIPFPSPYAGYTDLVPGSASGMKRTLAMFHEILSLTLEKRVMLRSFNQVVNDDFGLPRPSLKFLRDHVALFYVCHAGERPWVFLREAYDGGSLREKHPLRQFKERFFALCMNVPLEKYDDQEVKGSVDYDTEDSDIEMDDRPFRAAPVPLDDYDVDGWCMS